MKVNGKSIKGPRITHVVLPIGDGEEDYIVFTFRALTSKDDFENVMPRPQPPKVMKPGNIEIFDHQDAGYKQRINGWAEAKINWEFLTSISVTKDLEWTTIDMSRPETWGNWRTELEETFGTVESNRIFGGFLEANSLSDEKIEACRNHFLASQEVAQSES